MELRAETIAHVLGVPCETDSLGDATSGDTVIFVKATETPLVMEAKARGCRVVFDAVDRFCTHSEIVQDTIQLYVEDWYDAVDVLIVPNIVAARDFIVVFPHADYVVIPHQWDYRLEGKQCPDDEFRAGYVGNAFNLGQRLPDVEIVADPAAMIEATPRFNCHISHWTAYQDLRWKPATKISNAAAVGAVCLCSPSASALELLGDEYPFYIRGSVSEALYYAKRHFRDHVWYEARESMKRVRDKTSLSRIASKYLVFEPEEATA